LADAAYIPHIDLLLQALRINRDRLNSKSKIAIDARLLRVLIQGIAAAAPFSEPFYLATYPDVAEAVASGDIHDARRHFAEVGYIEGRFGAPPPVDDAFYTAKYEDVAEAVARRRRVGHRPLHALRRRRGPPAKQGAHGGCGRLDVAAAGPRPRRMMRPAV